MPVESINFNEKEMFLDSNAVNVLNTARCAGHFVGQSESLPFYAILSKTYDHNVTEADRADFTKTIIIPFYNYVEKALKSRRVAICFTDIVTEGGFTRLFIKQIPITAVSWTLIDGQKVPDAILTLIDTDIFSVTDNFIPNNKPNTLCFGFNID